MESLAEGGFIGETLEAIRRATDPEESDLFDALAYITYANSPLKRSEPFET